MAKMITQSEAALKAHSKRIGDYLGLDAEVIRSTYAESNPNGGANLHVEIVVPMSVELFNSLWFGEVK